MPGRLPRPIRPAQSLSSSNRGRLKIGWLSPDFCWAHRGCLNHLLGRDLYVDDCGFQARPQLLRSEEHTSELQSHLNLVCRLLLEKKKKNKSSVVHHLLTP